MARGPGKWREVASLRGFGVSGYPLAASLHAPVLGRLGTDWALCARPGGDSSLLHLPAFLVAEAFDEQQVARVPKRLSYSSALNSKSCRSSLYSIHAFSLATA